MAFTFDKSSSVLDRYFKTATTIKNNGGTKNIRKALDYLRTHIFKNESGSRPQASKIAFVFTDGDGVSVKPAASRLHDANVTVYAIGIGGSVYSEILAEIGSSADNVHIISDSSKVSTIAQDL